MADVSKVWIEGDECISCDACVDACPEVFEMGDDTAVVKSEAKEPAFCKEHSDGIIEAADACPVEVIKYE